MQLAAHAALERRIDHLVLLDAGLSLEGRGYHIGGIVVAVTGQIADFDHGIGEGFPDEALDLVCTHGHGPKPS